MTINNINSNLSTYFTNSILSILSTNNIPHTYNPTTEEITTTYIIIDLNHKIIINALTGEILFEEPTLTNNKDSFGSVKKFVCLDIPKSNSIMQHESDSEHSSPLVYTPSGRRMQHLAH